MLVLILSVVVLLVIGGCVCVFWAAARGDAPRWARGVAKATLLGSELARSASRNSRSQRSGGDD
ncbi:hypothetical protein STAFG_6169 [Streptomyces afghaniensis 772]|uniref:Uncharacterized protein n=1 Tax=Streptomyces afghaniensis 772 TaxID=1283301 RepID=S4MBF8_9ACTN|nr:hypothetical protein [Streptomyces afghaniensis]EPJ36768.1 hypothetical protein STAFG_6169 [Streptomyces afghaniensis 772]